MKRFFSMLRESLGELKKLRVLTVSAVLAALAVALGTLASIEVGPYIRIGFSGIPNQIVDWLFGPATGAIFAGALDIIKYLVKPTGPFFFGYTFSAMLAAFIYGVSYYKRALSFPRVLLTKGIVSVVVNMFFNTLWSSMLGGSAFFVLLKPRVLKNVIMWPIESVIYFVIVKAIEKTGVLKTFQTK